MRNLNNFLNNLLCRLKIDFLSENACPFGRFSSLRISFQTLSPRTIKKKRRAASLLIFINSGLRVSDYSVLKITIGKSHKIFEKFLLICFIATSYDFCYRQASKTGKLPDADCNICQGFLEYPFEPYELLLLHPQDLDVCPLVILPMKTAHTSLYEPFRVSR